MYPVLRLITTLWRAKANTPIGFADASEMQFRCMPWDLDLFMEMNNGRVLTLYDLGRFDLSVRSGLTKLLKEHNWGLVVAGSTVRYRKRVRLFDKVVMRTQLADVGERWIYLVQSMWLPDAQGELQPASSLLIRTAITRKGKVVSTEEILSTASIEPGNWRSQVSDDTLQWIEQWRKSEDLRPWPPA